MHLHSLTILAVSLALASPGFSQLTASPTIESVSGCAAVVSTTLVCSTCATLQCVTPVTITAGCGTCPDTPPTVYRGYPCEEGCSGLGGCRPVYTVVTAGDDAGECESPATTITATSETWPETTTMTTTTVVSSASSDGSDVGTGSAGVTTPGAVPTETGGPVSSTTAPATANAARRRVAPPLRFW
ncbi:hypothetical protein MMYC01_210620 [Madurella mycetomatis]|uniref:Uncharacterized protein n=1 Tax=Madurella mycetomatis TaxID=100816 RepID=A0A175VNI9_9PEZI|nr:hypothetical protein MMYC01_210620 [Madurella mycetomatis]